MKKLLLILILFTLSTRNVCARPGGNLPGGLMFPPISMSALINAAALTSDWSTEGQVVYSPPMSSDDPHSYSLGFGKSNGKFGGSAGYTGSLQNGIALHNAFAGVSARLGSKISLGVAVRLPNFTALDHPAFD